MFQMNNALQWIVSIALVLYVGYSLVKSGKEYSLYKKIPRRFLKRTKTRWNAGTGSGSARFWSS